HRRKCSHIGKTPKGMPEEGRYSRQEASSARGARPQGSDAMTNGMAPRQHVSRIRVLIVDDHAVLRQALKLLLENQPEVEVVGDAANGREAMEACERLHPDVVLMDMVMPGLNGLEATRQIRRRAPKAKVLI